METTTEVSSPTHCEVMWYDEEYRRLYRLEKSVPTEGDVIVDDGPSGSGGKYEVVRVRQSRQTFHGVPIVFVNVRKFNVALTAYSQGVG